jgi:membrane fusion protein (multidrug efflux system)
VRPDSRVVTLVDIDTLRLKLTVPEAGIGAIKEGQHVAFTVASDPGASYQAKVRYIGPKLRQSSRDLVVEAVVDNRDRRLKPGMFAAASVEAGQTTALLVPAAAIKSDGAVKHVFALVGQRLEERVIQAGDRLGDEIVVVNGLHAGDKVVSPITPELRDGLRAE